MTVPLTHHPVIIEEGRLRVDRWETADSQIISFFEEREGSGGATGLAELLERALLTGVIALRAAGQHSRRNGAESQWFFQCKSRATGGDGRATFLGNAGSPG